MSKEGRFPIRPWNGGLETAAPWLQIATLFQSRDCFPHHAITEVSLLDPQQFRAAPFLLNRFDLAGWSDRIEFPTDEYNASSITERLSVQR